MNLYKIRGGTKEKLENREYNIGVGISLGNKWFTPENTLELIKWALEYTRERVVVFVADSIHSLNIEARQAKNPTRAKKIALNRGSKIINVVKAMADEVLSADEKEKIDYVHWDDLIDVSYKQKLADLYKFFKENKEFKEAVTEIVKKFVAKEKRSFSDRAIEKMSNYVLEELPEMVARTKVNNISYDAYAYPFDTELAQFAEQLQSGQIFPEITSKILDTKPKVFLEVR